MWAPTRDDLDIGHGLGHADQLDADLVELAKAALLRPLVAEHRATVEELERQLLGQAAGDDGPDDAGRVLGAERQAVAAPVLEGVHLLGDDVAGVAEAAGEHLGELEDRRLDLAIAVEPGHALAPSRPTVR